MEYYPPPWIQVMSTEEIVGLSPGHIVRCCQTFSQVQKNIIVYRIILSATLHDSCLCHYLGRHLDSKKYLI